MIINKFLWHWTCKTSIWFVKKVVKTLVRKFKLKISQKEFSGKLESFEKLRHNQEIWQHCKNTTVNPCSSFANVMVNILWVYFLISRSRSWYVIYGVFFSSIFHNSFFMKIVSEALDNCDLNYNSLKSQLSNFWPWACEAKSLTFFCSNDVSSNFGLLFKQL